MSASPNDKEYDGDQESELPGIVAALVQSMPSDKPPTESWIVKTMAMVLGKIALPATYLFYWNEHIPLTYSRIKQVWIMLVISVIPLILVCVNYFRKSKETLLNYDRNGDGEVNYKDGRFYTTAIGIKNFFESIPEPTPPTLQDLTIMYMTCVWMCMFVLFVLFFPRLENVTK